MTPKAKFAITLASMTFIFMIGLLAIFSVYLLKDTINASYLKSSSMPMKKTDKNNGMSMDKMYSIFTN